VSFPHPVGGWEGHRIVCVCVVCKCVCALVRMCLCVRVRGKKCACVFLRACNLVCGCMHRDHKSIKPGKVYKCRKESKSLTSTITRVKTGIITRFKQHDHTC
jgi:hypothetical protein